MSSLHSTALYRIADADSAAGRAAAEMTARDWASSFWITLVDEQGDSGCTSHSDGVSS